LLPHSVATPPVAIASGAVLGAKVQAARFSLSLLIFGALASAAIATPSGYSKDSAPIPAPTLAAMRAKDTGPSSPILMRVFKKEAELEVWKKTSGGRFVLLKTFPICRWSGQLGPKTKEGDRQAPEGFYAVTPAHMNPNSAYHLSFDTGFPNAYDRARGATGSALMVHGTCSSRGCYAMTNDAIEEIFALAREAFAGGQQAFQFQAFPFRMTAENMVKHRTDAHIAFWKQLKEGSDRFEATGEPPVVTVAAGRYAFKGSGDEAKEAKVAARRAEEDARTAMLLAGGPAAVRTTYADGGQHRTFVSLARMGVPLGDISRPEALAFAGREIVVIPARPTPPTQVAVAAPAPAPAVVAKVWPAAPDLPTIQGSLRPLPEPVSLFAFVPFNTVTVAPERPVPGSLQIVPARLAEMTPLTFAPI
jgi:murein L,D-transpeptidase YafK